MDKEKLVKKILNENKEGLTIQQLSDKSKLSRATIVKILAKLEGKEELKIKNVGMAKLHKLKKWKKDIWFLRYSNLFQVFS